MTYNSRDVFVGQQCQNKLMSFIYLILLPAKDNVPEDGDVYSNYMMESAAGTVKYNTLTYQWEMLMPVVDKHTI